jgi:hypothetical protein
MSASYVGAMAQDVVHWPDTAKEPGRSEENPCEIFMDTVIHNKYLSKIRLSCSYYSTGTPFSS